jgi:catalase
LGVQLVAEADEFNFDFDLLDATKIIPEEQVPVRPVGRMVLNRNPDNFFAETEQVAFHTANVVPGIDFTNDPLLQARNFSYLDTQLIRLGGPNFAQLPVNRPVAEVHHHQRDGYGQHRIDVSPVSYHPNSIAGGCPGLASFDEGAYRHYTERVEGSKIRRRSESFKDFYSQATLFWNSMSDWEKHHIADAFQFELGKVERPYIRERVVGHLAHVDRDLATRVAEGLGLTPPPEAEPNHGRSSPALSQENQPQSAATRKVAVLAADGVDAVTLEPVLERLRAAGAICEILAPHGGQLEGGVEVDRTLVTMASVLYDAVLVAGGEQSVETLRGNGGAVRYVAEAYKHAKPVGAIGNGAELLRSAPLDDARISDNGLVSHAGVVTLAATNGGGEELEAFATEFTEAIAQHRHFDRRVELIPA